MYKDGTRADGTPLGVCPPPYTGTPDKALATLHEAVDLHRGTDSNRFTSGDDRMNAKFDVVDAACDLITALDFEEAFKRGDAVAAAAYETGLIEGVVMPESTEEILEPWRFSGPGFGPGRKKPAVIVDPYAVVVQIHGEEITLEDYSDTDRYGPETFDGTRIVFCFPLASEPTFEVRVLDTPEEVLAQVELRSGWYRPQATESGS